MIKHKNPLVAFRWFVLIFVILYNCQVMPIKLKACIIDDEMLAIASLEHDINKNCPTLEITASFQNPSEALEYLKNNETDLLFVDIEMPEFSGIQLLEKIGDFNFDVIFTTAYTEYALKAIKLHVYDYLLKPIDIEELKKSVNEIYTRRITQKQKNIVKIALTDINGIEIIDIDKIIYCLADKNYTEFHLTDKRKLLVSKNIGEYEKLLTPSMFFRIHQSTIINIYQISKILKGNNGSVIMTDGTELSISRANRKDFLDIIQKIAII